MKLKEPPNLNSGSSEFHIIYMIITQNNLKLHHVIDYNNRQFNKKFYLCAMDHSPKGWPPHRLNSTIKFYYSQ